MILNSKLSISIKVILVLLCKIDCAFLKLACIFDFLLHYTDNGSLVAEDLVLEAEVFGYLDVLRPRIKFSNSFDCGNFEEMDSRWTLNFLEVLLSKMQVELLTIF